MFLPTGQKYNVLFNSFTGTGRFYLALGVQITGTRSVLVNVALSTCPQNSTRDKLLPDVTKFMSLFIACFNTAMLYW